MFKRNIDVVLFFIILIIVFLCLNVQYSVIQNKEQYSDFLETVISFSSLTTAFLFFSVTLIPLLNDRAKLFEKLDTEKKLIENIMLNTEMFLLLSIYTLVLYCFKLYDIEIDNIYFVIWYSIICASIFKLIRTFYFLTINIAKTIKSRLIYIKTLI